MGKTKLYRSQKNLLNLEKKVKEFIFDVYLEIILKRCCDNDFVDIIKASESNRVQLHREKASILKQFLLKINNNRSTFQANGKTSLSYLMI